MRPNKALSAMLLGALFLLPALAPAARLILPPLEELARGHVDIMEARAIAQADDGRIVFERIATYYRAVQAGDAGDAQKRITVRVAADTRSDIATGNRYVVAYTSVINHPRRREEKLIDPDGARLVTLRGFSSSALFEATEEVRFLFQATDDAHSPQHNDTVVAALVRQLQRPDERTRTLVAGEIFLREDLRAHIDAEMARGIGKAIDDPLLSDELKSYLVETLASLPASRTGKWLFDSVRAIVDAAGSQYDLASHRPRLVSESLQALLPGAQPQDRERVEPLLRSNAPRVVESAIAVLEKLDPAAAAQTVSETLEDAQWDDSLSAPARRILEAYLVEVLLQNQKP